MIYNHEKQYRCAIIRGKAKNELDNILPAYAIIIDDICPCSKEDFTVRFNYKLSLLLKESCKKTLNNHRTEIAGKLFGMYYETTDGLIHKSKRTEKLLEDNDQPAFFKDICLNFQFPNGMEKVEHILEKIDKNISIRQFSYILKLLLIADSSGLILTKQDIGYYVLNSLEVLQSRVKPELVLAQIKEDRENNIIRKVRIPGKASSFCVQHINEQLNLLELANLIFINKKEIKLNYSEKDAIYYIASFWDKPLAFNVYNYSLQNPEENYQFYIDWQIYFSTPMEVHKNIFKTSISSLNMTDGVNIDKKPRTNETDKVALGDEGELFVLNFEKERVAKYNARLVNKVIHLGKTKGLGYDIQSVIAEKGAEAEFVKYIEVKSTIRVTVPNINDSTWVDTVNLTRNEWVAAQQHKEYYFIYRVYFTPGNITVYIIKNPYVKNEDGVINCLPVNYRMDFNSSSIDGIIS
jgi:hypothetical protein